MTRTADLEHARDRLDDERAALVDRISDIDAQIAELDAEIAREMEDSPYRMKCWAEARVL